MLFAIEPSVRGLAQVYAALFNAISQEKRLLSRDLLAVWQSAQFCDAELWFGSRRLGVHLCVLLARTSIRQSTRIDCAPEIGEIFVRFLYSDVLPQLDDTEALLELAEWFEVDALREALLFESKAKTRKAAFRTREAASLQTKAKPSGAKKCTSTLSNAIASSSCRD